ncbi:MAG: hypothetical protein JNL90_09640 [Planctomycetes bacterium]|nr:hypothetical protein [Planctomycetota bacterium]
MAESKPIDDVARAGLPRADLPRAGAPLRAAGWCFTAFLFATPLLQLAHEARRGAPFQAFDYFRPFAHGPGDRPLPQWLSELGRDLIDDQRLRRFETDLHDVSFLTTELLPGFQWLLTAGLGHGNSKAVTGRDGWLFFADDLKSAYGPGYLEPGVGGQEALAVLDDTRAQLEARGITLLLVPSYSKELLDADRLSTFTAGIRSAPNPDLERFYAELAARGHLFVRMDELFAQCRAAAADPAAPLALPRDTHWTPATMAFCAERIAARVRELLDEAAPATRRFAKQRRTIEGQGDLLRMLSLPEGQALYPPMTIELEPIVDAASGAPIAPDPRSDVLLMGDSLTKVFSDATLGLGEGAGLAEHLAFHLDRPLDVIAIPGGSATGTREALARRDGDGLAGKRLVLWQFGVRMLASGASEWQNVALPRPDDGAASGAAGAATTTTAGGSDPRALPLLGQPIGTKGKTTDSIRTPDYEPPATIPTDRVKLIGTLTAVSKIPPDFDYENTLVIHECAVERVVEGTLPAKLKGDRVWVAFPGRVDGEDVPPARYAPGMRLEMVLEDMRLRFDENVSWQMDMDAGKVIHYPLTWSETAR